MGVEIYILFKRFFSYPGFSEYSAYFVFCFRIFCKFRVLVYNFRILEYSVYSTIPFHHSVSAPVTPSMSSRADKGWAVKRALRSSFNV